MPKSAADLDKELSDFKQKVSDEIGQLKGFIKALSEFDTVDSTTDNKAIERLRDELEAVNKQLSKGLERIEQQLKEKIDDKNNAAEKLLDTKLDALKDRIIKIEAEGTQRKTWYISLAAISITILAIVVNILLASMKK